MDSVIQANGGTTLQIEQAVSEVLGSEPRQTPEGMKWEAKREAGIRSAILRPSAQRRQELDVVLTTVTETAAFSLQSAWNLIAGLIKDTDLTAVPIHTSHDKALGRWQITARLTLRDAAFSLPRLSRLNMALGHLDRCAKLIQAELPANTAGIAPQVPKELKGIVELLIAHTTQDTGEGSVCHSIYKQLQAGLTIAIVGTALRVRLELDRLAKITSNIAVLQHPTPIQRLPQLARTIKKAGLILASPSSHLRPRFTVYEQGREIEGMLQELDTNGLPVLIFGKREELESVFGVGQGRNHSPLHPVIQTLPSAESSDLVRLALTDCCRGLAPRQIDKLIRLVLDTMKKCGTENEDLLQPLSMLAVEQGANDPNLPAALENLARELYSLRDTFGTCEESPATPRLLDVNRHLRQRLGGHELKNLLSSKLLGQGNAICDFTKRISKEAFSRPYTEPLRLLLAGPVGTGKSMATKYLAELLGWPHHYIDATAFDSPHAVRTSLAGASPGIVNSFNDGILAKIARRPSVVEVADLDHAQSGVRDELRKFFLGILQEGTLQTGSGMVIRTIPSVIFVFTSNIAYGTRKASNRFGFGQCLTRKEVQAQVEACTIAHLGHAFTSRVGDPIIFDEFTRNTAIKVAEMEIKSLVRRVTGAKIVDPSRQVAKQIINSIATLEKGARGIIDATRDAMTESLQDCVDMGAERVRVRLKGKRIIIEARNWKLQMENVRAESERKDKCQTDF